MAELEVDQSNLPRVQEVSQYFSVLEDGALAHNLQEQEIEQHYSSNVQRNQLVQKDIRVAKRLQDEEQQRAQMVHEQTTRQLEQQDSEYARRIQEEIQRTTDEERKREAKDMEIAKRIQEEEEQYVRQSTRCRRTDGRENGSTIGSPNTVRPSRVLFSEEEESIWHGRELSPSPSPSTSDYEADHCEGRSSCNRQYVDNVERRHQPVSEPPLRRRSRQSRNSFASQNSTSGQLLRGWDDVVRLIKNDMSEQGYLSYSSEDELFQPVYKLERILSQRQQASEPRAEQGSRLSRHSSMREGSSRIRQEDRVGRMERYRNSEYKDRGGVRSENRLARLYSSNDCNSGVEPRRVRFQDDRHNFNTGVHRAFGETHVKKELRTCSVRPYRGDVPVERRASFGDVNRTHRHAANGVRTSPSQEIREDVGDRGRFRERGRWEGGSCRVQTEHGPRAHSVREELKWEGRESRRYPGEPSRRRVRSERWRGNQEDRSSTEEEEVDRDRERERRRLETRAPRHPQRSLSASCRGRSPGAGQRVNRPSLDLGELRQVLQDEELARRLQEEEEDLIRGDLASASPFESPYPQGDFTVAQVAQDEEIARFIQKQEIKAQLRSQEPEDCGTAQGFREMTHMCDNRVVCSRQLSRERLDSEGLMSPGDELSPEHQPPSPDTLAVQLQHPIRNIAEELDPTFHRKYNVLTGQSIPDACQIQSTSQAALCEEPAFVAPTKRQSDKPGRAKSKEKKEASKSKENCKQQ